MNTNLSFIIILEKNGEFEKIGKTQLLNFPLKNSFYTILPTKRTYLIKDIIFEDMHTILIVNETDFYQNITSLIYQKND
jgi:hypothetical protein